LPIRKFSIPYSVDNWWWGRYYSKDYTIVAGQDLRKNGNSNLFIYEGSKLIKSEKRKNIIFNQRDAEEIGSGKIPQRVKIIAGDTYISILNKEISRKTKDYVRFLSEFTLFDEKNKINEKGTGLTDFVFRNPQEI